MSTPNEPLDWAPRTEPLGPPAAPAPPVTAYPAPFPPPHLIYSPPPRNTNAIPALIAGCLAITSAWCLFSIVPALIAVALGHVTLYQTARANPPQRGRHMAIWSLLLGYVALVWQVGAIAYTVANR